MTRKSPNYTENDPFEGDFITLHLQRAEAGNVESARWLICGLRTLRESQKALYKSAKAIDKPSYCLDVLTEIRIDRLNKGGVRQAMSIKRELQRGQRGEAGGGHNQLRLAVAMWKQINLVGLTVRDAARFVSNEFFRSDDAARNAYYRFFSNQRKNNDYRHALAELNIDYRSHRPKWTALAASPETLKSSLLALKRQQRRLTPELRIQKVPSF